MYLSTKHFWLYASTCPKPCPEGASVLKRHGYIEFHTQTWSKSEKTPGLKRTLGEVHQREIRTSHYQEYYFDNLKQGPCFFDNIGGFSIKTQDSVIEHVVFNKIWGLTIQT